MYGITKMAIEQYEQEIESIRSQGTYSLSPQDFTTELHVAAFTHSSRRTVVESLIRKCDVDYVPLGHRYLMKVQSVLDAMDFIAKNHTQWKEE